MYLLSTYVVVLCESIADGKFFFLIQLLWACYENGTKYLAFVLLNLPSPPQIFS